MFIVLCIRTVSCMIQVRNNQCSAIASIILHGLLICLCITSGASSGGILYLQKYNVNCVLFINYS